MKEKPTILYADDLVYTRETVEMLLTMTFSAKVISAQNGAEAVSLALSHRPDLILLDMHMPKMTGQEAAETILKEWPKAKMAIVTASPQEVTMKIPVIVKGADMEMFLGEIRQLLEV